MTAPPNPDAEAFPFEAVFLVLEPIEEGRITPEERLELPLILERILKEIDVLFEKRRIRQKAVKQRDKYYDLWTAYKPPLPIKALREWYHRKTHRCGLLLVLKERCNAALLEWS